MTGYLTVGLILGLGGYGAFLLACRTREEGVVIRRVHPIQRYLMAVAAAARTALAVQQAFLSGLRQSYSVGLFQMNTRSSPPCSPLRVARATRERVRQTPEELFAERSGEYVDYTLGRHLNRLTAEASEALGRDDVHAVFDDRPLLPQFGSFVPCSNCGQPQAAHTFEKGFGLVCPTDAAARTDDERFTYTRPDEVA